MASTFLENLKKSVETSDFNSEAAKKIIELDKLADGAGSKAIETALENGGIKTVTEEEVVIINSDYEKKMRDIQEKDLALQQLAALRNIEEMVGLSLCDMANFIKGIDMKFDATNPNFDELLNEIKIIKNKYGSIINN